MARRTKKTGETPALREPTGWGLGQEGLDALKDLVAGCLAPYASRDLAKTIADAVSSAALPVLGEMVGQHIAEFLAESSVSVWEEYDSTGNRPTGRLGLNLYGYNDDPRFCPGWRLATIMRNFAENIDKGEVKPEHFVNDGPDLADLFERAARHIRQGLLQAAETGNE